MPGRNMLAGCLFEIYQRKTDCYLSLILNSMVITMRMLLKHTVSSIQLNN